MRPILFQAGGITLYAYGFFFLLGNLAWMGLSVYEARRQKRAWDEILPIASAVFVGCFIGARLSHALIEPQRAAELLDFYQVFNPLQGGRNLVGFFAGGALLGVVVASALLQVVSLVGTGAPGSGLDGGIL